MQRDKPKPTKQTIFGAYDNPVSITAYEQEKVWLVDRYGNYIDIKRPIGFQITDKRGQR